MVEDDIDQLLSAHPEPIQELSREIVAAIQASVPDATVKVARGWHSLNFRHPRAGYVCGVFPHDDRVEVAFEAGALLSDPTAVLEAGSTSGKRVRYVRYRPGDAVEPAILDAFVQESVALLGRR